MKLTPDAPNYKNEVLKRCLQACHYKAADRVKLRRGHRRGVVVRVYSNQHEVNWDKNVPHFIEVKWDDQVSTMCHYSQLKRCKT